MTLGWPQLIFVALVALGLGVAVAKDGEPRTPYSFVGTLIAAAIEVGLLYWGGFFSPQ